MDLSARKISFIQEFLAIQNEEIVSRLEDYLKKEKKKIVGNDSHSMTNEEFYKRIDKSHQDSINGRLTETNDFLSEIEKWD